jgi:hypothetical protein
MQPGQNQYVYELRFIIAGSQDIQRAKILVTGSREQKRIVNDFKNQRVFKGVEACANFVPTPDYVPVTLVRISA